MKTGNRGLRGGGQRGGGLAGKPENLSSQEDSRCGVLGLRAHVSNPSAPEVEAGGCL